MDELETLTSDEERLLEMALGTLEEPELPEGFAERFSQKLRAEHTPEVQPPKVTVLEARKPKPRRWLTPVLLAAAALVVFFGFLGTSQTHSEAIGVVATSEGQVRVNDASVGEAVALKAGMEISTEAESPSVLVLAEVSEQIRLDSDTVVTVNSLRQPQRDSKRVVGEFGLKKGRVWVTEKSSQVAVRTPHALLTPVGTEYEAISGQDSTEVVVWEGEVIAKSLDGSQSIRIQQGEELVLNADTWKAKPRQAQPIRENRIEDHWHDWNRRVQIGERPSRRQRLARAKMRGERRQLPGVQAMMRRRRQMRQNQQKPAAGDYPRARNPRGDQPSGPVTRQTVRSLNPEERQEYFRNMTPDQRRERLRKRATEPAVRRELQNMTPEQRQNLRRRVQNMTPEQRQRLRRNMQNRTPDRSQTRRDYPQAPARQRRLERRRQRGTQQEPLIQRQENRRAAGRDQNAPAWRDPGNWRNNPLDSNSQRPGVRRWRDRRGAVRARNRGR